MDEGSPPTFQVAEPIVSVAVGAELKALIPSSSNDSIFGLLKGIKRIVIFTAVENTISRSFLSISQAISSMTPLHDGRQFACGHYCGLIVIWQSRPQVSQVLARCKGGSVNCLIALNDGSSLLSSHNNYTIRIWNVLNRTCTQVLYTNSCNYMGLISQFPDGRHLLSKNDTNGNVLVWDLEGPISLGNLDPCLAIRGEWTCMCASSNDRIALGSFSGHITVFSIIYTTLECCYTERGVLAGHPSVISALKAITNVFLVSGSHDTTVRLWDINHMFCLRVFVGHTEIVTILELLPDGRLASTGHDLTVKFWNISDVVLI